MSKSVTSDLSRPSRLSVAVWQLAQGFWVGGLWLLQLVVLPMIGGTGLAPLLVTDISARLIPLMVALAAVGAALQALALVRSEGLASMWRDIRGQLLLVVVAMALVQGLALRFWPDAQYWLRFSYLLMAACGVLLMLQPLPGTPARR